MTWRHYSQIGRLGKPLTISQSLVIPCKIIAKSAKEKDGSDYDITLSFNVLAGEALE